MSERAFLVLEVLPPDVRCLGPPLPVRVTARKIVEALEDLHSGWSRCSEPDCDVCRERRERVAERVERVLRGEKP